MRGWAKRAALAVGAAALAAPAYAQNAPPAPAGAGADNPSYLTPPSNQADNPLSSKTRDFQGIALAGWMFYPEFLTQAIYNDNLGLASTDPRGAAGVRLSPDLYALRDTGLSKTEVYAAGALDLYPTASRDNEITGTIGAAETYSPSADLTIKGQAQFDRLGGLAYGGSVIGPGGQVAPLIAPAQANQAEASGAAQKSFGRFFLGLSAGIVATNYDPLATTVGSLSQSYRDSVVATLTERAGYWISPMLYGYAETAENWRQFADEGFASHGYRAVAGLGSDRIGLFRGEVYAGYQMQFYNSPLPGAASSPVLGAKFYWYPTRALTFTTALDETFTDSSNPAPGNPLGNPARDVAVAVEADYHLHRRWSAHAMARVDRAAALGAPRIDTTYLLGVGLDYQLRRNVDLSLGYTRVKVDSNALDGSYVDDLMSLGARYKF